MDQTLKNAFDACFNQEVRELTQSRQSFEQPQKRKDTRSGVEARRRIPRNN